MKHKVSLYFSLVCAAALFLSAAPLERYHTPEEVSTALKSLRDQHAQTAELLTIGRSSGGKDIQVLQIAAKSQDHPKPVDRPSILVTANLEGTHLIGTEAALHLAGELLTRYGKDKNITQLLHTRTIYIAPLLNPDVAGFYFSDLKIERKGNLKPVDDDLDGRDDEDGPDDLNKDGVITQMRVKDPEGTQIAHPSESRLLIQADPKKGQSGLYKVYTEGLDNDGDGLINEDHPGGVELNRNFPHDYEYNNPQTGLHPLSEKETVALIQFMLSKPNIVLVLNYSTENTFLNLQQTGRAQAAGNKIKATGRFATMLGLEEDKEYEVQEIVDIIKNSGMVPAGMEVDASLVAMIFGSGPAMNIDNLDMPSFLEIQKQYKDALKKAGSVLMEPIMDLEVTTPEEYLGDVLGDLNSRRAKIEALDQRGNSKAIRALVPLSAMFGYATVIRSLTQGRATYTMEPSFYQEVPSNIAEKIIQGESQ